MIGLSIYRTSKRVITDFIVNALGDKEAITLSEKDKKWSKNRLAS